MKSITKILLPVLLLLQLSCNNSASNTVTAIAEKVKIDNGGVNIEYDDSKTGDTSLLFIHGWAINKSYWADQVGFFEKRYRVVDVDLPGFGNSGKGRQVWSVENYGKDISAVIQKLDLKNVILIGHSMSGAIIVETALNNRDRVIGVIGIDNFKGYGSIPSEKEKVAVAGVYKAARANYTATISPYITQYLFSPSTDSRARKRILKDMLGADSVIAINVMEEGDKYPLDQKIKELNMPIYAINSSISPTDTASFKKNNIAYHLFDIGPTGHYPMIEKPAAFNALLQQVIDQLKHSVL